MSMKILGKWKHWAPDMTEKFTTIQTSLKRTHTFHEPTSPSTYEKNTAGYRSSVAVPQSQPSRDGAQEDPDTDDEDYKYDDSVVIRFSERELDVLRKAMRKWWHLAGLKHTPRCADEVSVEELRVDWTRAIAPKVEGRIRDVTGS